MSFGELLRRLRGSRVQREVAAELGLPVTTLSTMENQKTPPRGLVLKKLADYYGVPLAYFYSGPSSRMQSSDAAREWLLSLRQQSAKNSGIATHAPPEYSDNVKKEFAEKIKQKKRAATSDSE
jgi:transcriptional regulator with XRE-family HTH domain